MSHATSSEKRPVPHTPKSYPFRLRLKLKSNIHGPPSIVRIRVRYWSATRLMFRNASLMRDDASSHISWCTGDRVLDFLQWLGGFVYILRRPVESNALVVFRLYRRPRALVQHKT